MCGETDTWWWGGNLILTKPVTLPLGILKVAPWRGCQKNLGCFSGS
jgi:hypothetical protein